MKEIELIGKRKAREKHFLKEKGIMVANVYDEDIHFLKDGQYEEIDNTLIEQGNYIVNKNNAYKVSFAKISGDELMQMKTLKHFIKINLESSNKVNVKENITKSKLHKNICYPDILDNIDLEYNIMPAKVKEAIILKNKNAIFNNISFNIVTDLELKLNDNKTIMALKNGKCIFEIEAPYMVDAEFKTNNNICYELINISENEYKLKLVLDENWLKDENRKYPVMIDPTITNSGQDNSVYDTQISPGDEDEDWHGTAERLRVGMISTTDGNVPIRALFKFSLPQIGTGSQVINAMLNLIGYPEDRYPDNYDMLTIHQVTEDWDETTAKWNTMNDKYNSKVEGIMEARNSYFESENVVYPVVNQADITRLVKKWYTGTSNYGIMLKQNEEVYNPDFIAQFYSKDNNVTGDDPKPILAISYRNQNGIEDYMDYQEQNFSVGNSYVNNYNGNLTTIFNIGQTIGGKMPIDLNLIYNTNDVVLDSNIGYGLGYKLNLHQTIKERIIEDKTYLEYLDADGTLHYFLNQKTTFDETGYNTSDTGNVYYDEDGLDMIITSNVNDYVLKDKSGNTAKFIKNENCAYLSEIIDVSSNKITITYNSDNQIIKIVDPNNSNINISYENNVITIVSADETTTLNYLDNKLISLNNLLGTMYFEYDENNLISKITDIDGIKTTYEYYNQAPHKIKKVCEYGSNNTLGEYFEVLYGFDSTTITDSKGNAKNIIFNSQGSVVSTSVLIDKDSIEDAYGISEINGENDGTNPGYNNKLLKCEIPIKYVNNLLVNTSFEESDIKFDKTSDVTLSISDEFSLTGLNCLKAVSTSPNQILSQNISVVKGKYYTFSAYMKNTNKVKLLLSYIDENNTTIEYEGEAVNQSDEFQRHDVTIYYPQNSISDLSLMICLDEQGTTYVDDVQLETGEVENNYNLLENSNFSNGFSDWELTASKIDTGEIISDSSIFEVVSITDVTKALKVKMNPTYGLSMQKTFNVSGKAGDTFNLSFWYKNEGIDSNLSPYYGSRTYVTFNYVDQEDGHCVIPSPMLNINDQAWQYVSNNFVAEKDYTSITIGIYHEYTANDFYITNISLFKDIRDVCYEYDDKGNVIIENNLDNKNANFNYDKNNQLIQITNPKGKNFSFEYDNVITDRVINGISDMGVSNQIKYDSNNNPIVTKVINNNIVGDISSGLFKIRVKGTDKYLRNVSNEIKIKQEDCNHDLWMLEKEDEYFKIRHSIIVDKYFTLENNNLILTSENDAASLFKLIKNENGSYLIKLKEEDKYLKYDDEKIELATLIEGNYQFEFYFEVATSDLFIENNAEYTIDGRFIKSMTDSLGNATKYEIDDLTGLITKQTDAKENEINYAYNNKKQLIKTYSGNKSAEYEYDSNNLLSKVKHGTKQYNFTYDEFANVKTIKIGENITLVTNHYDTNGDLNSFNYGNNASINYEYDEFYRLKKMTKENDIYNYKYDSNGNLAKIISNNDINKYTYDLSKRLSEYKFNDFKIKYKYDSNDNVINKNYILCDTQNEINNTFNDDDLIIETSFDNYKIDYEYDELQRLKGSKINDIHVSNYEYLNNGKNTSVLIKNLKLGNDKYSYKYDKLNNITHIYNDNKLINKYYYDDYNELIKEIDYNENIIIKYKYDNVGNILLKTVYDLNTYGLISKDVHQYNNDDWEDQLTYFNNDLITYDEIGNPLTIGNNITLNWINGRELETYNDTVNSITYKYNVDGIRINKTINGIETKYYLEANDIVFEKTGNNILYFLRNDVNDLFGFKYNNDTYYYIKNIQNDIIGILDCNCNIVAKYKYDSWGEIISITDENGNDLSNNNSNIANINPFRYRSYYYDKETKLYYLNERYYNPKWRRFINSDSYGGAIGGNILSHNMYAYALNNPIMNYDIEGTSAATLVTVAASLYAIGKAITTTASIAFRVVSVMIAGAAIGKVVSNAKSKSKAQTKTKSKTSIRQLAENPSRPCAPASSIFGTVVPIGEPFTIKEAQQYVKDNSKILRDVVCINKSSAQSVAIGVNPDKYYLDNAHHGGARGYFPHYHDTRERGHAHIWYYITP